METDETYRIRARDAIKAARRGDLPKPRGSICSTPIRADSLSPSAEKNVFQTAQENSIEVYDDKFGRNTILTRSARMRKFKFYQYKPVRDSPSTPNTTRTDLNNSISSNGNNNDSRDSPNGLPGIREAIKSHDTPSPPLLIPREDVVQGRVALVAEQSRELIELDHEIAEIEKRIADLNNSGEHKNVNNLDQIFNLVNKKNDLLRRQMQLNIIEQEKVLEKANEELTKELRSLMSIDDSRKSKVQLERQKYLYEQSLALVNKRNELVHHMDVQEQGIEDDNALKAELKNAISNTATRQKLSQSSHDQNCVIQ